MLIISLVKSNISFSVFNFNSILLFINYSECEIFVPPSNISKIVKYFFSSFLKYLHGIYKSSFCNGRVCISYAFVITLGVLKDEAS